MHKNLEAVRVNPEINVGALTAAMKSCDKVNIDPATLAGLDTGLFRCLLNIGAPKSRICSALCLSYAEYDYILELVQES